MDIVIRTQQSDQFKRKYEERTNNIFYDKKWEWGFLRKQCKNWELEQFYAAYMLRLQRSYLSIFILIQALVGIIHTIMLMAAVKDITRVYPEMFSYLSTIVLVWASLFITLREDLIKRRPWVAYVASFVAVFCLVLSDLIVPVYHAAVDFPTPPLRPAYGSYILYAIYIFIPLTENWHSFILGMAVTICYLLSFAMVTYRLDDHILIKTISEGIFLLCVNLLGIYFRLTKEIAIRTTFLDRRECVEENLHLRYYRDQEKSLLLSIIPAQTADKIERDVRERIEKIKLQNMQNESSTDRVTVEPCTKRWRRPELEKLFIEPHNDVSVLYADVVNYTYLTTQLKVNTLVETLHELFVKFDQASEAYNVLRIKFLGDCYYCVSGVPVKNDHHAKSCVDLGLRMIKDIREVRIRRKLDIDMRIGVHSGDILSGVIGACKWQYDIWSKDVDIANRLESTGVAGRVHVSYQTLELLDGDYLFEDGTQAARDDKVLRKYNIRSFLIKPPKYHDLHRLSVGVRKVIENNRASRTETSTNFMQNTLEQYNQIFVQVKLEMSRELDKMPIGKFHLSRFCFGSQKRLTEDEMEEKRFRGNVSTVFLFFKDFRWEILYLMEPDVMLKYSILIGLIMYFGILAMQGINKPQSDLFWIVNAMAGAILICFLIVTWYKKLWIIFNPLPDPLPDEEGEESTERQQPKNKISAWLYMLSDKVMRSIIARGLIYLSIVVTLCASSLLQLIDCRQFQGNGNSSYVDDEEIGHHLCFNPWAITECLVLTICLSFLFTRIPFLFKFFVGFSIVAFYAYIVTDKYAYIYHLSPSTNYGLDSEYSHLLVVFISFAIFHLMDRQTEYISKVDYNWKRQLQKKQEDAQVTNATIKILVHNILPEHVAKIYMSKKMKNELYSEVYEDVAVMFATICNYNTEQVGLGVLNGIICHLDEMLTSFNRPLKIEKIKVAGWTYMAACGLDQKHCGSVSSFDGKHSIQRSSTMFTNGRLSYNSVPNDMKSLDIDPYIQNSVENSNGKKLDLKQSPRSSNNVVYVMTEFALELMKTLHEFTCDNFGWNGMLRIGISHGPLMAGVVGSSKPLYDIWGNAVNMASRMDSTGIPGCIQVTEDTAEILKSFNIQCDYRGLTFVKGRNYVPTYFVGIDKDLKFIQTTNKDKPSTTRNLMTKTKSAPSFRENNMGN